MKRCHVLFAVTVMAGIALGCGEKSQKFPEGTNSGSGLSTINVGLPKKTDLEKSFKPEAVAKLDGYYALVKPVAGSCASGNSVEEVKAWTDTTISKKITQGCDYLIVVELGRLDVANSKITPVFFTNRVQAEQGYILRKADFLNKDSIDVKIKLTVTKDGEDAGLGSAGTVITTPGETDLTIGVEIEGMQSGTTSVGFGDPASPNFYVLSDGTDLKSFDEESFLNVKSGKGNQFSADLAKKYKSLKASKGVYWVVRDLESGTILSEGKDSSKNVYGASVPKIIVSSAAMKKNGGKLKTKSNWHTLYHLLVNSDNDPYWNDMQTLAGGQDGVNEFTKSMGYPIMKAARNGGNAVNAMEMSQFYFDVLHNKFQGAEVVFKVALSCNTSASRAAKYLPSDVFLGGKTGTWEESNHDTKFMRYNGHWYAIVVLTELGSSENVAILHGGLFREFISKELSSSSID